MNKLLGIKGFIPYLAIVFLNAVVDLGHKITIQNVLLKSFSGDNLLILSALVNAMILLPFIFLFSPAGHINDKFSKTKVIRIASLVAVGITVMITISYMAGFFEVAFFLTLLLAIQSAIYSPAKYGLIKRLVGVEHLGLANGIIQAVTIVSILLSSFAFSYLFESMYTGGIKPGEILSHMYVLGFLLIIFSSLEAYNAFKLPYFEAKQDATKEKFSFNRYFTLGYLKENFKIIKSDENIWLSIIGLSLFWGISQVILAAFPAHFKAISGNDNAVLIQMILAVSTIGLIVGSTVAGAMSKHHIELGIVPVGAFGLFLSLFMFSTLKFPFALGLASLFFGFFGGLFIVPLNATIQLFSSQKEMGRVLAGNNFIQNIFMVSFLLLSVVFIKLNISTTGLLWFMSMIALGGSIYSVIKMPHLFARILLLPFLKSHYRFNVDGVENMPTKGGVLLLGNHISWIDWLILQVASPRAIKFVMYRGIYDQWYLNWIFKFFKVIPIGAGASKESIRNITARLQNGEVVALFPEGHISYNGQIGTFQRGFELAVKECDCPIVPFYLRGLWGSSFSRATKHYKELTQKRGKREIIVAFGKPLSNTLKAHEVKQKVQELSFKSWENFINAQQPFTHQWLLNAKSKLFKPCMIDALGTKLSHGKFITAVLIFKSILKKELKNETNVGVILPSSSAGAIVNMALFALGKVPINLNYTLSEQSLKSAVKKANITKVITSEKFLKKLSSRGFDFSFLQNENTIFAENVKTKISLFLKISSLLQSYLLPAQLLDIMHITPKDINDTATILFSSGSEGEPKGIELSHKNLLTNIKQVSELLNFKKDDVILNSLPIFHSFGLTVTTLLPLCEGVKMVSVPDPTDAFMVGKMAARHNATILFGTSTFFRLYTKNRKLHPLMFQSIRMVVAGAEKLKPQIKEDFRLKFGLEIYEGYGTTETAPVASVNMPNILEGESLKELTFNKLGSVGLPLPGTVVKVVDPNTLQELQRNEDGLILIGGGQVMKGYFKDEEKTSEVIAEIDGTRYYKTGDKGHLDDDGFIYITDRYSRFAKLGGEMVSLGSVEEILSEVFKDEASFIAVSVPDEKKGECVALIVKSDLSKEELAQKVKNSSMPPLLMPSHFLHVENLPMLASGKADFKKAKLVACEMLG